MAARAEGFYWVWHTKEEYKDWHLGEWMVMDGDYWVWRLIGNTKFYSDDDLYKINEERILCHVPHPEVHVGMAVEMKVARNERTRGKVTKIDARNHSWPYQIWYGPEDYDWVGLTVNDFRILED